MASPSASTSPAGTLRTSANPQPGPHPHRAERHPRHVAVRASAKSSRSDPSAGRCLLIPLEIHRSITWIPSPGARHHNSHTDENHSTGHPHPGQPRRFRSSACASKARTGSSGRPRRFPGDLPGAHPGHHRSHRLAPERPASSKISIPGFSSVLYHEIPVGREHQRWSAGYLVRRVAWQSPRA